LQRRCQRDVQPTRLDRTRNATNVRKLSAPAPANAVTAAGELAG
jgi:hypothetical protein